ncbi:histidine phosphatase family protein [Paenibacillus sp. JX-17]|uniref:Histidine phosphatase family protein n=1 Tax=Paenibacillus lacisoli TaxID=3064525 RepID=A0ABT9CAU0_9BACL|nr:histidine phosphatase family protein [Paenibacillus sp. JX-17]MDO7905663.1 histidine phosphatase family protein [Paenibacillus sp. JX-17]
MTTTIGIIRHGSTHWNQLGKAQGHTNNPLDEQGKRQAELLGERLSRESWDAVYASDLLRARETAEIVAEKLGAGEVHLDERLREMNGGQIEGTTEEERVAKWGKDWKKLDLGLEMPDEGMQRGSSCIEDIARRHPGQRILIVSHGALIRNSLRGLVPDLSLELPLHNTSLTLLQWNEEQWGCDLYNCTVHLD